MANNNMDKSLAQLVTQVFQERDCSLHVEWANVPIEPLKSNLRGCIDKESYVAGKVGLDKRLLLFEDTALDSHLDLESDRSYLVYDSVDIAFLGRRFSPEFIFGEHFLNLSAHDEKGVVAQIDKTKEGYSGLFRSEKERRKILRKVASYKEARPVILDNKDPHGDNFPDYLFHVNVPYNLALEFVDDIRRSIRPDLECEVFKENIPYRFKGEHHMLKRDQEQIMAEIESEIPGESMSHFTESLKGGWKRMGSAYDIWFRLDSLPSRLAVSQHLRFIGFSCYCLPHKYEIAMLKGPYGYPEDNHPNPYTLAIFCPKRAGPFGDYLRSEARKLADLIKGKITSEHSNK